MILFLGLTLWPVWAQAQAQHYQNCTNLTRTDPKAALKMAEEWSLKENTASSHHCRALALFALKRYEDAARALDHLSGVVGGDNRVLWANILRQSAKSWELSGNRAKAVTTLTRAIQTIAEPGLSDPALGRLSADLLLDRGQLYASGGRDLLAVQDLDQAIALTPAHEAALLARANLFIRLSEPAMARQDLQAVLRINPSHAQAKALLGQLN
jgi:tetratricopeptide (TPR) repeat protein